MPASITMTNRQKVDAGVTVLDQDGQPFATLPDGVTVSFTSSDVLVAPVTQSTENPFNCTVTSGVVGTAVITAAITGGGLDLSDTLAVAVQNSAPGSANFTVGTPVDE